MQIQARMWTGDGPVERRIIEVQGDRIARLLPWHAPLRPDALVFPDSALLIPGFHDAHTHLLAGGLQLGQVSFADVSTPEEFSDRLSSYAANEAIPHGWIEGAGLDETRLRITRTDIDRVCADVPVFIWSHDLHSAFVNSAALVAAGIDRTARGPKTRRYERDAAGDLTGVLREMAAYDVRKCIPLPSRAQAEKALLRAQDLAFSLGITAVGGSARGEEIAHYLQFADTSNQRLRVNLWKVSDNFDIAEDRFDKVSSPNLRYATLKGFADGALGSRTAAFWEPYVDEPAQAGVALAREGPLARWVRESQRDGYQLALHAIGDRANSICLDAIEMAGAGGRGPEYRPRIEHAQVLRPRDVERFAELGVIASMQPIHCTADMRFVEPRIGSERAKGAYAWRSLLDSGAVLAFGSDWPVERLDPIAGIHAAVTRQNAAHEPPGGWHPNERVTIAEALRAYTGAAAYAAFWEDSMGRIQEGMQADFAVLSQDLFSIPPEKILDTGVLATIVGGEIVYRAAAGVK